MRKICRKEPIIPINMGLSFLLQQCQSEYHYICGFSMITHANYDPQSHCTFSSFEKENDFFLVSCCMTHSSRKCSIIRLVMKNDDIAWTTVYFPSVVRSKFQILSTRNIVDKDASYSCSEKKIIILKNVSFVLHKSILFLNLLHYNVTLHVIAYCKI